jgi:N-acetylglucosaminyl-diphospho-decaprenol L-rhamnosyltransferase
MGNGDWEPMEIEAVVVTHNSETHIVACLDSLRAEGTVPIVVDNESTDSTIRLVREGFPQVRVITANGNRGYGTSVNMGFRETSSPFVLLSNSDVVYPGRSVQRLLQFLSDTPDVGLVGGQLLFPNGKWQRSYANLPGLWSGFKAAVGITTLQRACRAWLWPVRVDRKPKDVPYVDGAVLLVRREAFEAVGGFDESFFRYGDECDLCARIQKAGWRTVSFPEVQIVHVRGGDSTQILPLELFQNMVEADMKVARKHISARRAKVYFWLRQVEFQRLTLIYRLASFVAPRGMTEEMTNRSVVTGSMAHIWRDKRRQVLRTS